MRIVIGTAAVVGLALAIGIIGVAIITVTPVVEAIGVVIAALSGPIGLAILVIAALTAAIVANWGLISKDTETIWNGISSFFSAYWSFEKNLFTTSLNDISAIWKSAWNDMSTFLGDIWTTIQNTVKTGVDYVITAINGFINALDAIHISIPSISIPGTKLATPSINLRFSIPDIPMLAEGGFVTQPTLALIGEAGPEAVIPLSGAGAGVGGQPIQIFIQGGYYLDQNAATQIGNALAKLIVAQLRTRNYAS